MKPQDALYHLLFALVSYFNQRFASLSVDSPYASRADQSPIFSVFQSLSQPTSFDLQVPPLSA